MARDLANALEKRPIEARRASALLRLRRWSQRHPARSTAAAISLVLALGLPSFYVWQQERGARALATQRDAAVRAFQSAMRAVELMLSRVGGSELANLPAMEPLRRRLLEGAVELLEGFVAEGQLYVRREGRLELAAARQRLAQLKTQLGRSEEALPDYELALTSLRELLDAQPEDAAAGELLLSLLTEEAALRGERGEFEAALALHAEIESRFAARADEPGFAGPLAHSRAEHANSLSVLGRFEEADSLFERARTTLEAVARGVLYPQLETRPIFLPLHGRPAFEQLSRWYAARAADADADADGSGSGGGAAPAAAPPH